MPISDIERPNFYEGQYLDAADLVAAQEYERQQDQRHRLAAHTWGIAVGLELEERQLGGGAVDVYIKPGYAVDGFGRAIVVLQSYKIPEGLFPQFQTGAAQLIYVSLRYREKKTSPPHSGFAVCESEKEWSRIQETFQVAVTPGLIGGGAAVSVDGKAVNAFSLFPDASVPYQVFPAPANDWPPCNNPISDVWLIPIGRVTWSGTQFIKSTNPATLVQGRRYIGVVADSVLAPAGKLRIKDRLTQTNFANETTDLAGVEGSLRVDELLTVRRDAHILGQAGIGTDVPASQLHVKAASSSNPISGMSLDVESFQTPANASSSHFLRIRDLGAGPSNILFVRGDGNIGIGTATPAGKLTVSGTDPRQGSLTLFAPDSAFSYDGGNEGLFVFKDNGGKTAFLGGNVGIGTATPARELHVEDEIHSGGGTAGFSFGNRGTPTFVETPANGERWVWYADDKKARLWSGSDKLVITPDGNMGIGTTSPTEKLEIVGNLKVSGLINGHDLDAELQALAQSEDVVVITGEINHGEFLGNGITRRINEIYFISLKNIQLQKPNLDKDYVIDCELWDPVFHKVTVQCVQGGDYLSANFGSASYLVIGWGPSW